MAPGCVTFARRRNNPRSVSAIDPREVTEAAKLQKQKLAAKRARNKTGVNLSHLAEEGYDASAELPSTARYRQLELVQPPTDLAVD